MLDFMEYVERAFYDAVHWNQDNSYLSLTGTSQALLDFETPRGLRFNVSSLASPNFANSYSFGTGGFVNGSVAYLFTSTPLSVLSKSGQIALGDVVRHYRHLRELRQPDAPWLWETWHGGKRVDRRDSLLYGRLFLPRSILQALYLRRISPSTMLKVSCVSNPKEPNYGNILFSLQQDAARHSVEYLYSTDSALLGVRGLYNFNYDPRPDDAGTKAKAGDKPESDVSHGRFSAGAELYYGARNKSGGASAGVRFATLPTHSGFPYTMAVTLNPLMGNLAANYAVSAGRNLALCSRFEFNVYSYESDLKLGCELWRNRREPKVPEFLKSVASHNEPVLRNDSLTHIAAQDDMGDDRSGVFKARVDQNWNIGLLWEGRLKELLFTVGASFDLKRRSQIVRAVGVEFQYSS